MVKLLKSAGRRTSAGSVVAMLFALALPACGSAQQPAGQGVGLEQIGRFDSPVYVTGAPGFPKRRFVGGEGGRVRVLRGGRRLSRPFLDPHDLVSSGGERGLLSIAFPPDYKHSRRFYVYYTDSQGNIRIDEFKRRGATRAAGGSRRAVVEIPHPVNANHNGGQLQFLGNLLYFGTGDGGSGGDPPNNAHNPHSLLGKPLRIDPARRAPPPGTFTHRPRNPFRLSLTPATADQ